ncbi:AAA family ATPase [Elizabethkingia anophelis]|nr:AAA family ATPase [Elizabethkingia anophelis]
MSKIKKIEISDFRIYEGTSEFNLEKKDYVANLVAIYAPNGYGKTSFFDAIEWTFSNKIKRFENDFTKKAIKSETENTILLTNSDSYKKGIQGKVNIELDNSQFIGKLVSRYKKPGTIYYNDYRQGNLSDGSITSDFSALPSSNVLTQDQIDSFLRFKTPEERFNELKDFWPQSFEATERLKQLSDLLKTLNKKRESIDFAIKKNDEELAKLNGNEENISKVNIWLDKLTKVDYTKFTKYSVEKIDKSISKENFEKIHKENSRNIKQIQIDIENLEKTKSDLDYLIKEVENYINSTSKLKSLEASVKQLQTRKSNYLNLRKSKELEGQILKEIEILKVKIGDYHFLLNHLDNYLLDVEKINQLRLVEQTLLKENSKFLEYKKYAQNSIINFNESLLKHNSVLSDKKSKEKDLQKVFSEFESTYDNLEKRKQELIEFKEHFEKNNKKINELQELNQSYSLISDKKNFSNTLLNANIDIKAFCDEFEIITNKLIDFNSKLTSEKNELNTLLSFNDDLDKVIMYGKGYLIKTESSDCPLCKTTFNSFQEILSKIDLERLGALKIVEQQKIVDDIEKEIKDLTSKSAEIEKSIISKINIERTKLIDEISSLQENKNKLSTKIIDCEKSIKRLSFDFNEHLTFFKEIDSTLLVIDNNNIKIIEKNIKEEIIKLSEKENRLKIIIEKKEAQLKAINLKLIENSSVIETNKNNLESIEAQEYLKRFESLILLLNIDNSNVNIEYLNRIIKEFEENLKEKSAKNNEISVEVRDFLEVLESEELKVSEPNIDGEISNSESQIKLFKDFLENYVARFNKYIISETISSDVISDFRLNINSEHQKLTNLKNELNSFGIDLELIKDNVIANDLSNRIIELESEIPPLIRITEKVSSVRKDCMEYIQTGINDYFNKDVINLIYGRIEPHPKLTKIDFVTDFNDRGEPRLLITTGNEEGQVNPILFLSAGQVNVLSLSIFLARCFEYGDKEIETIFMDDPIQNLSDINVLSFIDLLRTLITEQNKQIIISTHDEKFFRLLQNKLPEEYCSSKYFEFESMGKLLTKTVI